MKQNLLYIIFILLSAGCIPNKKIVYLQSENELKVDMPTDSLIKQFTINNYEYKLQPGDVVSIKVSSLTNPNYSFFTSTDKELNTGIGDPQLNGFSLNEFGDVFLPAVGQVKLEGLTLQQAQMLVQNQVENILERPTVNLKLLSFHFSILGEVNAPGKYISYNSRLNILEAVAMARDLTVFANRKNIKIVRFERGQANVYYLNLLKDDVVGSHFFYLRPNDLIVVAPMRVKNIRQNQLPVASFIISTVTGISMLIWRLSR
jgi:polysaccharide biosynthesis/export protein